MIHSSTLGFSPHPPVSVSGTGSVSLLERRIFLQVWLPALSGCPWTPGTVRFRYPYAVQPTIPSVGGSVTPRSPLLLIRRLRNLDRISIVFPFRVRLRSRLTLIRLALIRNPGVVGAHVSACVVVTHAYIFFSGRSSKPPGSPSTLSAMLPYQCTYMHSLASAAVLMPVHHPRVTARLVSCYALFE